MADLNENVELLVKNVESIQKSQDDLEKRFGGHDAVIDEKTKKMAEDVTKKMQEMQDENQKKAAEQQAVLQEVQKEILRISHGGEKEAKKYDKTFAKFLRKGYKIEEADLLKEAEELARKNLFGPSEQEINLFTKDLVAGSDADGGIFLSTDRSSDISTRIFETSPLRSVANIETTTSDIWEIVLDDDEPDAGWVGEVDSRPDTTTAKVALIKIPIHELYASPKATQKMLDDAGFDIAGWHQRKVTNKFNRMENTAFVTGDGSQKPKGFLDYPAWASAGVYERNAVEQRTGATNSVIEADDLIELQSDLIEDYQNGAIWGMKRKTFGSDIMTLKDSFGQYLLNPRMIAESAEMVMLGKPVVFMNDMPDVADGALPVIYGDFSEFYTIVDRFGIRVLRDPYTLKPYVKFYTTKRVGGAVTNFEAAKILKIKTP